jgi:hypothetical protein
MTSDNKRRFHSSQLTRATTNDALKDPKDIRLYAAVVLNSVLMVCTYYILYCTFSNELLEYSNNTSSASNVQYLQCCTPQCHHTVHSVSCELYHHMKYLEFHRSCDIFDEYGAPYSSTPPLSAVWL